MFGKIDEKPASTQALIDRMKSVSDVSEASRIYRQIMEA